MEFRGLKAQYKALKKEIDRVEDVKNEKSKALELAKDYFKK